MSSSMRRKFFSYVTMAIGLLLFVAPAQANTPPQAAHVGYTVETFNSHFLNDIDLRDTRQPGFHWYLGKWFGWPAAKPSTLRLGPHGGLTIVGRDHPANYTIGTAASVQNDPSRNWVGTAFGGGGYFEAELAFDPDKVVYNSGKGFPAWWMEPVEHMVVPGQDQWIGQAPSTAHYAEIDIFEYNMWEKTPTLSYGGTVHDWYNDGKCKQGEGDISNFNGKSSYTNAEIKVPPSTDFHHFHKYGLLWIPATSDQQGYVQYYFDGKPTSDKVAWDLYQDQPPPPGKTPWTFGVADRDHFVLILGTGDDKPLKIKSVRAWQSGKENNLSQ